MASSSSSSSVPPVVHAIGGSIGSALALLILYPLERARIEIQSEATIQITKTSSNSNNNNNQEEDGKEEDDDDEERNIIKEDETIIPISNKENIMDESQEPHMMITGDMIESSPDNSPKHENETSTQQKQPQTSKDDNDEDDKKQDEQQENAAASSSSNASSTSSSFEPIEPSDGSMIWDVHSLRTEDSANNSQNKQATNTNQSSVDEEEEEEEESNVGKNIETDFQKDPNSNGDDSCAISTLSSRAEEEEEEKEQITIPSGQHHDGNDHEEEDEDEERTIVPLKPKPSNTQKEKSKTNIPPPTINVQRGIWTTLQLLHRRKQLYRGATPIVATLATSNFIFFYALQFTRKLLLLSHHRRRNHHHHHRNAKSSSGLTVSESLLASSLAGIINVLLTNPLWVANLRIIYKSGSSSNNNNKKENLFTMIRDIVHEDGFLKLWSGTTASLLLVCNPVLQHFAYEQIKHWILLSSSSTYPTKKSLSSSSSLRPMEAFIIGALAKAFATVLTYPLQLAQTLIRLQQERNFNHATISNNEDNNNNDNNNNMVYKGTMHCLIQLYKNGGWTALFHGMDAKLVQTVLTAALTFCTYEQILSIVEHGYYLSMSMRRTGGMG